MQLYVMHLCVGVSNLETREHIRLSSKSFERQVEDVQISYRHTIMINAGISCCRKSDSFTFAPMITIFASLITILFMHVDTRLNALTEACGSDTAWRDNYK